MAYADSIRAATATTEEIASLIEGLLIGNSGQYESDPNASAISTTSTSFVDVTSASVTVSVAANEKALVLGQLNFSQSVTNAAVLIRVAQDGTGGGYSIGRAYRSSTGGQDGCLFCASIFAPSAGSRTYTLQWRASSDTAYTRFYALYVFPFQAS